MLKASWKDKISNKEHWKEQTTKEGLWITPSREKVNIWTIFLFNVLQRKLPKNHLNKPCWKGGEDELRPDHSNIRRHTLILRSFQIILKELDHTFRMLSIQFFVEDYPIFGNRELVCWKSWWYCTRFYLFFSFRVHLLNFLFYFFFIFIYWF